MIRNTHFCDEGVEVFPETGVGQRHLTCTLMSPSSASFLFLVLKTWNGRIFLASLSYATTSQSSTKVLTDSCVTLGTREMISGYFVVLSSEFLLKIFTVPSSSLERSSKSEKESARLPEQTDCYNRPQSERESVWVLRNVTF